MAGSFYLLVGVLSALGAILLHFFSTRLGLYYLTIGLSMLSIYLVGKGCVMMYLYYSRYKYFSARGLVVMAKNFYALGDAFQATYILESVISNFPDFDDVVQEATLELNKIKIEGAKTNSSIETDEN